MLKAIIKKQRKEINDIPNKDEIKEMRKELQRLQIIIKGDEITKQRAELQRLQIIIDESNEKKKGILEILK